AFMSGDRGEGSESSGAQLRQADEARPEWRDGADEATLRAMSASAGRAEELARRAYQQARDEVDRRDRQTHDRQTQDAMGQLVMGAAIGALLSSGGRGGGGGFGGPWGGGGFSGGGWGGGGGCGGSCGGGGGGRGCWGG